MATTADNYLGATLTTNQTPSASNNNQSSYYNWATASNWSNGVPTSTSDFLISGSSNAPTFMGTSTVSSLSLNAGYFQLGSTANLTITSAINVAGSGTLGIYNGALTVNSKKWLGKTEHVG